MTECLRGYQVSEDADRNAAEGEEEQHGEGAGCLPPQAVVVGVVRAEGLEHGPGAMVDVHAQTDHGDEVGHDDRRVGEPDEHHPVCVVGALGRRVGGELGVRHVRCVLEDVVDDEGQQQDAAVAHRLGGVAAAGALQLLVALGSGAVVQADQLDGRGDVQREGREQGQAHSPEQEWVRLEARGVVVEGVWPQPDQHVAGGVDEDESDEDQPGDGHDDLLPDSRSPQVGEPAHHRSEMGGAVNR